MRIRGLLGCSAGAEVGQEEEEEVRGGVGGDVFRGEARGRGAGVVSSARRALVGAGARVLFYRTVAYNLFRNRTETEFHWWDRVDEYVVLGAIPLRRDVPVLKKHGVIGVVTLNEPFETIVPSSLYKAHGIDHLEIPTRDYLYAPSQPNICRAVNFIHKNASQGGTTYVHCKAGRGRSTTVVVCYLIKYKNMTRDSAYAHVQSVRPRVLLADAQWKAVTIFEKKNAPVQSANRNENEESVMDTEVVGYTTKTNRGHLGIPTCHSIYRPTSPSRCSNMVIVTDADLDGYESDADPDMDAASWEVVSPSQAHHEEYILPDP